MRKNHWIGLLMLLLALALGGSILGACGGEPGSEDLQSVELESVDTSLDIDSAEQAIYNCSGATPFVCHRPARGYCQPGGHLCGPGYCKCACEWYCCDSPSNTCS